MSDSVNMKRMVTSKLSDLLARLEATNRVGKKVCREMLEELADVVIAYDTTSTLLADIVVLSNKTEVNVNDPSFQPKLSLEKVTKDQLKSLVEDSAKKRTKSSVTSRESVVNGLATVDEIDDEDEEDDDHLKSIQSTSGCNVRYKSKIVGMESLNRDSDDDSGWEPRQKRGRKASNSTTASSGKSDSGSKTRNRKANANNNKKEEKKTFAASGQRLGGGDSEPESERPQSLEERRKLMLKATEQRVTQSTARGVGSGTPQLRSRRAPAELPDAPNDTRLRWSMN